MTLERFVFVTFLIAMLFLLTACGGDSDSIMEPAENTMDYVIRGRATLITDLSKGVPDLKVMVYKRTEGGWTAPAETTVTDEDGQYSLRFRGNAEHCPIADGDPHIRGYHIVVVDTAAVLFAPNFTAQCGMSPQTWNPRMKEHEDNGGGGCFIVCDPIS